ncbi:MAG: hypothetical protein ACYCVY_10975 [Acidiferrobacteraceae bacterium]
MSNLRCNERIRMRTHVRQSQSDHLLLNPRDDRLARRAALFKGVVCIEQYQAWTPPESLNAQFIT